jgi:hypothetical protein
VACTELPFAVFAVRIFEFSFLCTKGLSEACDTVEPSMNEEPLSVIIIQRSKDQDERGFSRPSELAEMSAPDQLEPFR